ncbi:MAG: 3-methyl-2-oxobutanoate hydroxymethyltransferase [Planctomycetes bacterium]|nr:3-methyl-2-oxobutanoate hydroxymethyltransferase [Planctomycetota bacterium]MBI3833760.1 3-methyl-2-oxobutanoate hydroxymethyltransferase [Planctomycetota bacterium]
MPTSAKITLSTLQSRKREKRKVTMITCYDFPTARIMQEAGVDSLLVGDTYAEVCLGHPSTLRATVDQMVPLCEAVRRGAPSVFLVGDMPYLSYQACVEEAIHNAGRFMADGGCDCVKIEVDRRLVRTVEAMSSATIPVMAHLGLKPQSVHSVGGYKIQGKRAADAKQMIEDAKMMEQAGAAALLLEAVPDEVATIITQSTELPVIGIIAGSSVDGQVVVFHDLIGYGGGHPPRSLRPYADIHSQLLSAFQRYVHDVSQGAFPLKEHSAPMDAAELQSLQKLLSAS